MQDIGFGLTETCMYPAGLKLHTLSRNLNELEWVNTADEDGLAFGESLSQIHSNST